MGVKTKKVTILVVDDSDLVRLNIKFQLESFFNEINILLADSVEKAWLLLKANKVDIALIDIYFPGENGADLINDMLNDDDLKSIPVIVVTGTKEDSFIKASFKDYVHAYLHKPVKKDELWNAIQNLVE